MADSQKIYRYSLYNDEVCIEEEKIVDKKGNIIEYEITCNDKVIATTKIEENKLNTLNDFDIMFSLENKKERKEEYLDLLLKAFEEKTKEDQKELKRLQELIKSNEKKIEIIKKLKGEK